MPLFCGFPQRRMRRRPLAWPCLLALYLAVVAPQAHAAGPGNESGAQPAIRRISVLGERHSGTNYVMRLLTSNLAKDYAFPDNFAQTPSRTFGAKHCHAYPRPQELGRANWGKRFPDVMQPSYGDALAIVVLRNPFDWALALHKECWCNDAEAIARLPFGEFIRREMVDVCMKPWKEVSQRHQPEPCPHPLACRAAKYRGYFNMRLWAPNVEIVRYEDILTRRKAERWMQKLVQKHGLRPAGGPASFVPVAKYKDTDSEFNLTSRLRLSPWFHPKQLHRNSTLRSCVDLINQHLDVAVERLAGYTKLPL